MEHVEKNCSIRVLIKLFNSNLVYTILHTGNNNIKIPHNIGLQIVTMEIRYSLLIVLLYIVYN